MTSFNTIALCCSVDTKSHGIGLNSESGELMFSRYDNNVMARYTAFKGGRFVPSKLPNACDTPAIRYNAAIQYVILIIAIAISLHTIIYEVCNVEAIILAIINGFSECKHCANLASTTRLGRSGEP